MVSVETWNRCATAYNTLKEEGMAEFQKFLSNFGYDEVQEIIKLFKKIETEGYSHVRDEITKQ